MHEGRLIRCEPPDALKRNIREECYEVKTPDSRRAREVLRQIPGVTSVEPAGAGLHLFLSVPQASPSDLAEELRSVGLTATEFKRIVPSLEDAFIALIGKAGN